MFRAARSVLVLGGNSQAEQAMSAFVSRFSAAAASQRLAGKVAVITGGASGIGKATAAEFVRNGARVVLADVQDDLGHAAAAELGADAAVYTRCDVTDEAQVAAAVDLAVARHGRLDVVFNNAGIGGCPVPFPVGDLDMGDFDRVMAVNARAVVAGDGAVQRVQGRRGRAGARRGRGAGALRRAGQRHLAQLHPDAAGDGRPGAVVPRDERRGAQAGRGEGDERDGRAGAGGGGRGEGGAVPGVRRVQVHQRPQPRRRWRLHGGEGAQHAEIIKPAQ